jgi:hypothetical protein
MASAAPRLSPEIITTWMPRARSAAKASRRAGFGLVGKRHQGAQDQTLIRALGHGGDGGAFGLQGSRLCGHRAQTHAQLIHPAQAADGVAAVIHLALGAAPRHGLELLR